MKDKSQIVILSCLCVCVFFLAFSLPSKPVRYNHITPRDWKDTTNRDSLDKNITAITTALESLNNRLPIEKVYLHTDKPWYNIGDTLWFKAYLANGSDMTPSKISGLLYVEMITDSAEMVDRISIRVKNGLGWGQMPLRKIQYQEGGYTLRAYTSWTKNFGSAYVFKKRFYLSVPSVNTWLVKSNAEVTHIGEQDELQVSLWLNRNDKLSSPVALKRVEVKIYDEQHYLFKENMQTGLDGSLKFSGILKNDMNGRQIRVQITAFDPSENLRIITIPLAINRSQNIDLQFLPEGGNLVQGLKSVVGFKALAEDGRGTNISGSIIDSKGNIVVNFAALHNGMGAFEFTPKFNETYVARIEEPKSVIKTYTLPTIASAGTVLHIDNPEKEEQLKINLQGLDSLPADSGFYLIGTSRGTIWYSQTVGINQKEYFVNKKLFPTGIARFTLFKGKTPLNERAVFIDNKDQLHIEISRDKKDYLKRDCVSLGIEVKDEKGLPVQGSFSLSVTDNSQVKTDNLSNYSIATSLLINADLKGDIESPGYYTNRIDKKAWQALNNLMLAQGWTGYNWKDVFAPPKPVVFEVQKNIKITGRVVNVFNKPAANIPVLISSQKPAFLVMETTNNDGFFTFSPPDYIDTGSYFFQASQPDGKPMRFGAISIYRSPTFSPSPALTYPILPWYVNSDSTQINYVKRRSEEGNDANLQLSGIVLNEVKIKEKKLIQGSMNPYGAGEADYVFNENDIKKSGLTNLYDFIKQNIPGIRILGTQEIYFRGNIVVPVVSFNHYSVDIIKIDGWPLQVDDVNGIDATVEELSKYQLAGIKGIELAYSRKFTNKSAITEGKFRTNDFAKIEITTYNGQGWAKNFKGSTTSYKPLPVTAAKVFYSPKYHEVPSAIVAPDYRATLFWEPNINTDQFGKATVSFRSSDSTSGLTAMIQGLSQDGSIGSSLFRLKP
jgi:hypothetical protein